MKTGNGSFDRPVRLPAGTLITACLACLFVMSLTGCRSVQQTTKNDRAIALARRAIIIDGHVDVPYRLQDFPEDVCRRTIEGDFDYIRAREGGLDAPFIAIYIPPEVQNTGREMAMADELIGMVEQIIRNCPEKFAPAHRPEDILRNSERGLISIPMGLENGAPIGEDFRNLHHLFERGIRYVTLSHGTNNQICDASYDTTRTWNGLSPFGKQLIPEMNRIGMIIDVSHVSDSTIHQVVRLTKAPIIASHSSVRAFTPDWERNLDDDLIQAIASTGGLVMINFGSIFLKQEYKKRSADLQENLAARLKENNAEEGSEEARRISREMRRGNPIGTVEDVVDHIDHVVQLVGVDHVGLGSDFDGVYALPAGLEDVSGYPNLVAALLRRGYSESDVEKILGKNFLRVWTDILQRSERN